MTIAVDLGRKATKQTKTIYTKLLILTIPFTHCFCYWQFHLLILTIPFNQYFCYWQYHLPNTSNTDNTFYSIFLLLIIPFTEYFSFTQYFFYWQYHLPNASIYPTLLVLTTMFYPTLFKLITPFILITPFTYLYQLVTASTTVDLFPLPDIDRILHLFSFF